MLNLKDVSVEYTRSQGLRSRKQVLHAAHDVSLEIGRGESLGLVGESGSGKSTVAGAIEGLVPVSKGTIEVGGEGVVGTTRKQFRALRRRFQMVFQDPYSSLDPSMSIGATLVETLKVHKIASGSEGVQRAGEALESVGLTAHDMAKYPQEFSGGQRQRIAIARALMPEPDLLILDEAVSALDVSTRAQVLQLLQELRRERGLAFLFIGHDLAVVEQMSDRIAVMYLGRIVEVGSADEVVSHPEHPYTASLLASVPRVGAASRAEALRELQVRTEPPDPWNPPQGCTFSSRCPFVMDICRQVEPPMLGAPAGGLARCHLLSEDLTDADVDDSRTGWNRARSTLTETTKPAGQARAVRN